MGRHNEVIEAGMRIRFAREEDLQRISEFIRDEWDAEYSYATNPDLLQFIHARNGAVWYVILENINSLEILGTLGYILCNDLKKSDVAVTLLKEKQSVKKMMGIKMILFLHEQVAQRVQFSCGIRPNTINIYEFFRWKTAKLDFYYKTADFEEFKICKIYDRPIVINHGGKAVFKEFVEFSQLQESFDVTKFVNIRPYKDMDYLRWRYYEFPYYKYRVWGIEMEGNIESLLIGREITYAGNKMLTIVDYIGKESSLTESAGEIQRLMTENCYEYIEFMCYGLDRESLEKAGFILRGENDKNIIPSHFEPYLCENVEKYFYTTDLTDFRIFRADANQDVPRYIKYINKEDMKCEKYEANY